MNSYVCGLMKRALLHMHLAVILWGFTGVLGRAITLSAPVLVWYRMLFTFLIMGGILTMRQLWVKVERKDLGNLFVIGCLISLHWVAFYAAIKFANVSIALVCLSTASIFTSLLDPLVNKGKHDLGEVLLGLLAIAGVYLIYRFQEFYGKGIAAGIVAAILSSAFTVLNKRIAHKYPSRTMVFYEMLSGWGFLTLLIPVFLWLMPGAALVPAGNSGWPGSDWIWLAVLSLCCTVWAQSLALSALKKLSSFTVTLSVNLEPVYGILLAFLCYHENKELIFAADGGLNWGFLTGMGLILLSVVLQMNRLLAPSGARA